MRYSFVGVKSAHGGAVRVSAAVAMCAICCVYLCGCVLTMPVASPAEEGQASPVPVPTPSVTSIPYSMMPVEGITLYESDAALVTGDTLQLHYIIEPKGVVSSVLWESDNIGVAAVDCFGVVTAISSGSANITASCNEYSAKCRVAVEPRVTSCRIACSGDIIVHDQLNADARLNDGSYSYDHMFDGVAEQNAQADFSFCCIETTFRSDVPIAGYPCFNTPPQFASALANAGFDLIMTASNHCMDTYREGMLQTLEVLDENGLAHVGTYSSYEEYAANRGVYVATVSDIRIAFIDYTYALNGFSVAAFPYAVNIIFSNYLSGRSIVDYDRIDADILAAKALCPDIILVDLHWGHEYQTTPSPYQYALADHLIANGVDIIIGGHPHVPQPVEVRTVTRDDGSTRTAFIAYSLGNLISAMNSDYTYITATVNIDIEKNQDTGETRITMISLVPLFMCDIADGGDSGGIAWRYKLLNINSAIADYENGETRGYINSVLYARLVRARDDLYDILGANELVYPTVP